MYILHTYTHTRTYMHTVPPRITHGVQRTDANLDQPVSLTCRAEGTQPLQWVWRKDTTVLQQSQGGVTYTTSGVESVLTISSVRESDGGVYQCVVTQPATGRQNASNEFLNPIGRLFKHSVMSTYVRMSHFVLRYVPYCRRKFGDLLNLKF